MNTTSPNKVLYYDCFSGISGDMNLACMIELGVDPKQLIKDLGKLNIEGWSLEFKKDNKNGIWGTKVNVICDDQKHHRTLEDITSLIKQSKLKNSVKDLSINIFKIIAKAEAKVHNTDLKKIHFHEVGAIDSIIDIVGSAICYDYLNVDKIVCSTIELGGGFVKCAHGKLPVPAPATVEILKGIPVKSGRVNNEITTPTGAAILVASVDEFTDKINFSIDNIAYGIGHRDLEIPNVLRAYIGTIKPKDSNLDLTEIIIECNIDDMNPELYDFVFEKLFEAGASDVFITPIIMKKSRPANKLTVLFNNSIREKVVDIIYRNTTTIGFREYPVIKNMLKRMIKTVNTKYGEIRIKEAYLNDELVQSKPEYEDCKLLAKKHNVSINEIYKHI